MSADLNKFHRETLEGLHRECRYEDTRPGAYPDAFIAPGRFPSGKKTISQLLDWGLISEGKADRVGTTGYRITEAGIAALAAPPPAKEPKTPRNPMMPAPSRFGAAKTRWDK